MINQLRSRHIIIITIFILIGTYACKKLILNHDKKRVIEKLENYKKLNSIYPNDLGQIDESLSKIFYYSPDSLSQSFTISYSSGIMNINTNRYNNRTKEWEEVFNY